MSPPMNPVSQLHAAALAYAQQGWHVFPLSPNKKVPLISKEQGGRAHHDATTDPAQISAWWTSCPNANIGLSLPASGLCALDVDTSLKKDGTRKKGRESLEKIDHELTDSLTSISARGGLHVIYRRPADLPPKRQIEVDDGLDVLSEGYIVLPPSVFIDADNNYARGEYRWSRPDTPIAPLPPYLEKVQRSAAEKVQLSQTDAGAAIVEGGRNIAMFRLGCALRAQGLSGAALAAAMFKENETRFKPPLDDAELATIHEHVMQQVTPHRDAAAGAIVEQDAIAAHAPKAGAIKIDEYKSSGKPPQRFFPTAFPKLNECMNGGLATRHHVGVIGPPSCGKSGFINELVLEQSKHTPSLIYSAELPTEEVRIRLAARIRGFPWSEGLKGRISPAAIDEAVRGLGVWIIGSDEVNRDAPIEQIYYEAQRIYSETGVMPTIFEDYVQLLARGSEDKVRHKVGELSMAFRIMSQNLDTPVVAVYSTGRAYYGGKSIEILRKAQDPTAFLAAAKECGDIEYDCATLLYLDLDKLHEGLPKPAQIAVARCRVGNVGFVGARAQLDIGGWSPDQGAVAEMSSDERAARDNEAKLSKICGKVYNTIKNLEGRSWREIRQACGAGYREADMARDRLLEQKLIKYDIVETYDGLKRKQRREILRVAAGNSPAEIPVGSYEE